MTRDDIIRMAREAGFTNVRGGLMDNGELSDYWDCWPNQLERFAALVAAAALAEPEVQSTHSAECYKWHHECAKAEVERLRAALKEKNT